MQYRIAVAGGTNMDIGGTSKAALNLHDSNPGTVTFSPGGVGRNIAHNLALLGLSVTLYTALGDDAQADRIVRSCTSSGMELRAPRMKGCRTPVYLYIADADGDMVCAVSDMDACDRLRPECFEPYLSEINSCHALVIDTNLPEETVRYLATHVSVPVFADPVSVTKADRLRGVLPYLYAVKPNRLEAARLSGVPPGTEAGGVAENALYAAADALLDAGVRQVYLSLGTDGVLAADKTRKLLIPAICCDARGHTGAGDAFMAGLVYAYCNGMNAEDSAKTASAAAAIAVQSTDTINPRMSVSELERMLLQQA